MFLRCLYFGLVCYCSRTECVLTETYSTVLIIVSVTHFNTLSSKSVPVASYCPWQMFWIIFYLFSQKAFWLITSNSITSPCLPRWNSVGFDLTCRNYITKFKIIDIHSIFHFSIQKSGILFNFFTDYFMYFHKYFYREFCILSWTLFLNILCILFFIWVHCIIPFV